MGNLLRCGLAVSPKWLLKNDIFTTKDYCFTTTSDSFEVNSIKRFVPTFNMWSTVRKSYDPNLIVLLIETSRNKQSNKFKLAPFSSKGIDFPDLKSVFHLWGSTSNNSHFITLYVENLTSNEFFLAVFFLFIHICFISCDIGFKNVLFQRLKMLNAKGRIHLMFWRNDNIVNRMMSKINVDTFWSLDNRKSSRNIFKNFPSALLA